MNQELFAFVLMPFDKDLNDTYVLGIKSAAEDANMSAERVDDQMFHHEGILDRIRSQIDRADVIVAEQQNQIQMCTMK